MPTVRTGPLFGLIAQVALLVVLDRVVGLAAVGLIVGAACGLVVSGTLARGLSRAYAAALGPADRVTLIRSTLVGGVAALVASGFVRPTSQALLVTIATVALVLDAVDGWVARRTGTASALGARFDMEIDAFLILVLSVQVARSAGVWVLAIGLARYAFVTAGRVCPWLRRATPARYWCKTVAAIQGIVLTVAVTHLLSWRLADLALVGALALLCESFGHDVVWLWQHRPSPVRTHIANRRGLSPVERVVGVSE